MEETNLDVHCARSALHVHEPEVVHLFDHSGDVDAHVVREVLAQGVDEPSSTRSMCHRCRRPQRCCICEALPDEPLETETNIVILLNPKEAKRKLGTAPLLQLCLKNVTVVEGYSFPEPEQSPDLHAAMVAGGRQCTLMFPGSDAQVWRAGDLREAQGHMRTLIFVDGTWAQATTMVNRSSWLSQQHRAVVETSGQSGYAFRKQPQLGCLSTLEAVAETIVAVEEQGGLDIKAALLAPFQRMVSLQCSFTHWMADKNAVPLARSSRPFILNELVEFLPPDVRPGSDEIYCIVRNCDRSVSTSGLVVVQLLGGPLEQAKRRATLLSVGKTRGRRYWVLTIGKIPDGATFQPDEAV